MVRSKHVTDKFHAILLRVIYTSSVGRSVHLYVGKQVLAKLALFYNHDFVWTEIEILFVLAITSRFLFVLGLQTLEPQKETFSLFFPPCLDFNVFFLLTFKFKSRSLSYPT